MSLNGEHILLSLLVSCIGLGLFLYGRKQSRPLQLVCGVGLMAYPYFVESLVWMAIIAVLIVAGLWGALKLGL